MDAMQSARASHAFMGVSPRGRVSIVRSRGNNNVHVILRGGSKGTNFDPASVAETRSSLIKAQPAFHPSIMIDCSHGNCKPIKIFFLIFPNQHDREASVNG
jgi:3-deoxy-7-phosphoheptulonate synthase